jgi:hypothetical protein
VRQDCIGGFVVTLLYGLERPTADTCALSPSPCPIHCLDWVRSANTRICPQRAPRRIGVKRGALPALSVFPPHPLRRASCWWIIGIPPWPSFRTARNLRLVNNPFLPRKGVVAPSGVVDVEDSTTPQSWRDLPEPRKTCFIAELVVAERLRGLDARSATGGKADCKGNNENEHNDGHEIGERVRRAEA